MSRWGLVTPSRSGALGLSMKVTDVNDEGVITGSDRDGWGCKGGGRTCRENGCAAPDMMGCVMNATEMGYVVGHMKGPDVKGAMMWWWK